MIALMMISVLAASAYSCILNKTSVKNKNDVIIFNIICSAVWFVILLSVNGATLNINYHTLVWGIIYGMVQSLFILFKTEAMSTGPVSVTTLIGNSSLLISIFVYFIVWNESINFWDIVGLLCLCIAIFLCTYKKPEGNSTSKWKYYVVLFLVFAAMVGITFKAFGKSQAAEFSGDMMAISALVMVVFYTVAGLISGGLSVKNVECGSIKKFCLAALASGVLSCAYNRLNIFLASKLDAIIFFPSFNGGVVLLSMLLSILICRERLSKVQIIGIVMGIASICIIGIL